MVRRRSTSRASSFSRGPSRAPSRAPTRAPTRAPPPPPKKTTTKTKKTITKRTPAPAQKTVTKTPAPVPPVTPVVTQPTVTRTPRVRTPTTRTPTKRTPAPAQRVQPVVRVPTTQVSSKPKPKPEPAPVVRVPAPEPKIAGQPKPEPTPKATAGGPSFIGGVTTTGEKQLTVGGGVKETVEKPLVSPTRGEEKTKEQLREETLKQRGADSPIVSVAEISQERLDTGKSIFDQQAFGREDQPISPDSIEGQVIERIVEEQDVGRQANVVQADRFASITGAKSGVEALKIAKAQPESEVFFTFGGEAGDTRGSLKTAEGQTIVKEILESTPRPSVRESLGFGVPDELPVKGSPQPVETQIIKIAPQDFESESKGLVSVKRKDGSVIEVTPETAEKLAAKGQLAPITAFEEGVLPPQSPNAQAVGIPLVPGTAALLGGASILAFQNQQLTEEEAEFLPTLESPEGFKTPQSQARAQALDLTPQVLTSQELPGETKITTKVVDGKTITETTTTTGTKQELGLPPVTPDYSDPLGSLFAGFSQSLQNEIIGIENLGALATGREQKELFATPSALLIGGAIETGAAQVTGDSETAKKLGLETQQRIARTAQADPLFAVGDILAQGLLIFSPTKIVKGVSAGSKLLKAATSGASKTTKFQTATRFAPNEVGIAVRQEIAGGFPIENVAKAEKIVGPKQKVSFSGGGIEGTVSDPKATLRALDDVNIRGVGGSKDPVSTLTGQVERVKNIDPLKRISRKADDALQAEPAELARPASAGDIRLLEQFDITPGGKALTRVEEGALSRGGQEVFGLKPLKSGAQPVEPVRELFIGRRAAPGVSKATEEGVQIGTRGQIGARIELEGLSPSDIRLISQATSKAEEAAVQAGKLQKAKDVQKAQAKVTKAQEQLAKAKTTKSRLAASEKLDTAKAELKAIKQIKPERLFVQESVIGAPSTVGRSAFQVAEEVSLGSGIGRLVGAGDDVASLGRGIGPAGRGAGGGTKGVSTFGSGASKATKATKTVTKADDIGKVPTTTGKGTQAILKTVDDLPEGFGRTTVRLGEGTGFIPKKAPRFTPTKVPLGKGKPVKPPTAKIPKAPTAFGALGAVALGTVLSQPPGEAQGQTIFDTQVTQQITDPGLQSSVANVLRGGQREKVGQRQRFGEQQAFGGGEVNPSRVLSVGESQSQRNQQIFSQTTVGGPTFQELVFGRRRQPSAEAAEKEARSNRARRFYRVFDVATTPFGTVKRGLGTQVQSGQAIFEIEDVIKDKPVKKTAGDRFFDISF